MPLNLTNFAFLGFSAFFILGIKKWCIVSAKHTKEFGQICKGVTFSFTVFRDAETRSSFLFKIYFTTDLNDTNIGFIYKHNY